VDYAFASALYQATNRPVTITPEIKAIQERIANDEAETAELNMNVSHLAQLLAHAKENEKEDLAKELDLAKARQELNADELADAHQDLERAGGDPQSRVQRMVDEYNASEQGSGGKLDLSIVGTQGNSMLPASGSFLSRGRAWYLLNSLVRRLGGAERDAAASAASFSGRHDQLEKQLEEAQSEQSKKMESGFSATAPSGDSTGAPVSQSKQVTTAITSYKSLANLQKRLSGLDRRIRNVQDLANTYEQWRLLVAGRRRALLHGLLISIAFILGIGVAVMVTSFSLEKCLPAWSMTSKNS
jgi:hypothetical protein